MPWSLTGFFFFAACLALAAGYFLRPHSDGFITTASRAEMKGSVVAVYDGDSFVVRTTDGRTLRARLYGVDSPELRQKDGAGAANFARDLLLSAPVALTVMDTDQYGRAVVFVYTADGRSANEELVRAGHAWVYRSFCNEPFCQSWLALERQAKKLRLGLWRQNNPMPPWQWRRANPRQ